MISGTLCKIIPIKVYPSISFLSNSFETGDFFALDKICEIDVATKPIYVLYLDMSVASYKILYKNIIGFIDKGQFHKLEKI